MAGFFLYNNKESVLEFGGEILSVQTSYMIDSYVLRALHLTCAGVGAGTESELVHLGYHCFCTLCGLYLALRK